MEIFQIREEVFKQVKEENATTFKYTHSSSFPDLHVRKALQDLHNNFVINTIDKANGNAAVICKRFYALALIKELGLNKTNNGHKTYK